MLKTTTLFIISALMFTNATDFTITNNCPDNIVVNSDASQGGAPIGAGGLALAPGQSGSVQATDWVGRIFINTPGSLVEFALNQGGSDFFDISFIDGFDRGIQITPSNGCPGSTCPNTPCSDAYMTPTDDFATRSCPVGTSYQITYCP